MNKRIMKRLMRLGCKAKECCLLDCLFCKSDFTIVKEILARRCERRSMRSINDSMRWRQKKRRLRSATMKCPSAVFSSIEARRSDVAEMKSISLSGACFLAKRIAAGVYRRFNSTYHGSVCERKLMKNETDGAPRLYERENSRCDSECRLCVWQLYS